MRTRFPSHYHISIITGALDQQGDVLVPYNYTSIYHDDAYCTVVYRVYVLLVYSTA